MANIQNGETGLVVRNKINSANTIVATDVAGRAATQPGQFFLVAVDAGGGQSTLTLHYHFPSGDSASVPLSGTWDVDTAFLTGN